MLKHVCSYYCVSLEVGKQDSNGTMCDTTIETASVRPISLRLAQNPLFSQTRTPQPTFIPG